jgi:hypothetical protein
MVSRLTSIAYGETPISSEKYERETNWIFENLNAALSFNTSDTPPTDLSDGLIWYDSNYVPPLMKRWNESILQWEWGGNYIYAPGDQFPPEGPMKGATRFNSETGVTEYWTGLAWVAVSVEGLGSSFSGNGAYLWDKEPRIPSGFFYPVIGSGWDRDPESSQGASDATEYRDIFVIGGNAKAFKECMVYSLNAGASDWKTVIGLDTLAPQLGLDPELVVTVERIIGFNGDMQLPQNITQTPWIFAIIRAATGDTTGYHYVIGIRVTDNGSNVAGTAVKGILVPEQLTVEPLAAEIYNGKLRIGGSDAMGIPTMWDISWTDTNFQLDPVPAQVTGYTGAVSGIANYYTRNNVAGFLNDGRDFGYVQALLTVGPGVGEPVIRMGFVQPDNRLVGIGKSGKLYNGVDGTTGKLPAWSEVDGFNGVDAKIYDGIVAAKRHNELWVGSVTMYGVEYGAIFERKMGGTEYQVVWQNESDDIACSIAYNAVRNSFITLGRDRVTGELMGIYDSDLRSVSDYFASINQQLQTLTSIVNKAMYRGGARKGEIRAWTKPVSAIPEGWALCDGKFNAEYGGNTPNLMNRTLRGFGSETEDVLNFLGADSVTLSTQNLPEHAHGLKNHTHNITAVGHTHTFNHTHGYTGGAHSHGIAGGAQTVSGTVSGTTSSGGQHSHSVSQGSGRVITHNGVLSNVASGGTNAGQGFVKSSGYFSDSSASGTSTSTDGQHNHSFTGSFSGAVSIPQSTNSSTPGIQISSFQGSTGPATGVGSITSAPSVNISDNAGNGAPVTIIPSSVTVFWIIATRDHAAAEGIDTSFLSAEQMMAILHATAPGPDNPFLTRLDVQSLPAGSPGLSAYELAVSSGFQGTQQQWLDSLDGPSGESAYAIALNNGFIGTQAEWIASLKGKDGADGDGKSAYTIAVENGFTGTEQEWISSLHGQGLPSGGSIGQVPTKFGTADYAIQWADVPNVDEVQVFDHVPTEAEMLAIPDDTIIMIGNTDPTVAPFGVSNLDYDLDTNEIQMTLVDGRELTATIPTCSMSQDGLMAKEDCATFHELVSTVETLAQGGVFRASFDTLELFTATRPAYLAKGYTATADDIANWNVSDFIFVNSDSAHTGLTTSYIMVLDTDVEPQVRYWVFRKDEVTQIQRATNLAMGIVQGTANDTVLGSTDGKIRVESDGTMTLNGWNRVVENKMDINDEGIDTHLIEFGPNGEAMDSGKVVEDFATAAQGLRADTSVQKPATVTENNIMAFDGVGNAKDTGVSAGNIVSQSGTVAIATNIPMYNDTTGKVITDSGLRIPDIIMRDSGVSGDYAADQELVMGIGSTGRRVTTSGIAVSKVLRYAPDAPAHSDGSMLVQNASGTAYGQSALKAGALINNLTYSTTETPTGAKWINGLPIYRRIFQGITSGTEGGGEVVAGIIPTGSGLVSVIGLINVSTGSLIPLNSTDHNVSGGWTLAYMAAGGSVRVAVGAHVGYRSRPFHIAVEYVKN